MTLQQIEDPALLLAKQSASTITYPTMYDVVTGRDRTAFSHPGNNMYRLLIHQNREAYQSTHRRKVKAIIIRNVMKSIQSMKGRFLAMEDDYYHQGSFTYRVMTDSEVLKKISHALRSSKGRTSSRSPLDNSGAPDQDDSSCQDSHGIHQMQILASSNPPIGQDDVSVDAECERLLHEQRQILENLLIDAGDDRRVHEFCQDIPSQDDSQGITWDPNGLAISFDMSTEVDPALQESV